MIATETRRLDVEMVPTLRIHLEQGDTPLPDCSALPEREYVGTYYEHPPEPLAIAELPSTGAEYAMRCSRVLRQNAGWSARRGYVYRQIDRAEWEADLHALRASCHFRQGRRMPAAYLERQSYGSDVWPEPHCKRHLATVHGIVAPSGHLVAYAQAIQCGEVFRLNTILGHADYLQERVMWLLMLRMTEWHIDTAGASYALYYAHMSGYGHGLRYFKERTGYRPAWVTWVFR